MNRRNYRTLAVLALLIAVAVMLRVPLASGGYVAKVSNSVDTAGTSGYFTCQNAALGETGTRAIFAYPFSDSLLNLFQATDATGNGRTGAYTLFGITYGVSDAAICPRDGNPVITLDGTQGYISGFNTPAAAPATFTEEIWFKTTAKGGRLIGYGSSRVGASATDDRHLYLDSNGFLTFGVGNNITITSPKSYADGKWHYAAASLSSAGMKLWADGLPVATSASTAASSYTGYWRIGYDSLAGWPSAPTNYFFKGSLAWAAAYSYRLTDAQVAAHFAAGTS